MLTEVETQRTVQYKLETTFWLNNREKTNCHPYLSRSYMRLSKRIGNEVMLKASHGGTYRRNVAHVKTSIRIVISNSMMLQIPSEMRLLRNVPTLRKLMMLLLPMWTLVETGIKYAVL